MLQLATNHWKSFVIMAFVTISDVMLSLYLLGLIINARLFRMTGNWLPTGLVIYKKHILNTNLLWYSSFFLHLPSFPAYWIVVTWMMRKDTRIWKPADFHNWIFDNQLCYEKTIIIRLSQRMKNLLLCKYLSLNYAWKRA